MNIEVSKHRAEEIMFPNESTMILSRINAQMSQFNPSGTLLAIGCKYANILIMDFLTKEILRCFNIYEEYDRPSNDDVDQFIPFRKNNFTYFEDDFVLMQKNVILPPS